MAVNSELVRAAGAAAYVAALKAARDKGLEPEAADRQALAAKGAARAAERARLAAK